MQLRNVEEVTLDLTIDGYGAMSELVEAGKVRYLDISGRRSSASGAPTPCTRSARCRPSAHCGRETSKPRSPRTPRARYRLRAVLGPGPRLSERRGQIRPG